jgi:hypothetical protein
MAIASRFHDAFSLVTCMRVFADLADLELVKPNTNGKHEETLGCRFRHWV